MIRGGGIGAVGVDGRRIRDTRLKRVDALPGSGRRSKRERNRISFCGLALQLAALKKDGCKTIFNDDGLSGATTKRPAL
ncbi:MAG: hypothetical protein M3Y07_10740, partial [Acidobacteriota bacterium]|nr:hypothetical protein [Acidobacteriota bacterium]